MDDTADSDRPHPPAARAAAPSIPAASTESQPPRWVAISGTGDHHGLRSALHRHPSSLSHRSKPAPPINCAISTESSRNATSPRSMICAALAQSSADRLQNRSLSAASPPRHEATEAQRQQYPCCRFGHNLESNHRGGVKARCEGALRSSRCKLIDMSTAIVGLV